MKEIFNAENSKLRLLLFAIGFLCCQSVSFAQPVLPQRTITVTATQSLYFGTICVAGAGGTVIMGYDGSRTSSGDLTLLPMAPTSQPAVFEIKLCQGRSISISYTPSITLTGSDGGLLTLDLGPTEKGPNGASFLTNSDCNFVTPLRMGGTLYIPGTSPPGMYTGSFDITLNQE